MQEQLSLMEQAHERGTLGLLRAANRTERALDGWVDLAIGKLREFAAAANDPFTIERAQSSFAASIPAPKDLRAFGAVTRKACKLGIIRQVGYAPAVTSNGSPKPLYVPGEAVADSFLSAQRDSTQISPVSIEAASESVRCRTDALDDVGDSTQRDPA